MAYFLAGALTVLISIAIGLLLGFRMGQGRESLALPSILPQDDPLDENPDEYNWAHRREG